MSLELAGGVGEGKDCLLGRFLRVWGRAFGWLGFARVWRGVFGGLDGRRVQGARCKVQGASVWLWDGIFGFTAGNRDGEPLDVCSVYLLTQHPPDGAMSFFSMSSQPAMTFFLSPLSPNGHPRYFPT